MLLITKTVFLAPAFAFFFQHPAQETTAVTDSALAKQIPGALVFMRCPDIKEWVKRTDELAISKLFEDEEVVDFFNGQAQLDRIIEQIRLSAPDVPEDLFKEIVSFAENGFSGEMSFAVAPPRVRIGGAREPEIYFSANVGNATDRFDKLMGSVLEYLQKLQGEKFARRVAEDSISYYEFKNPDAPMGVDGEGIRIGRRGSNVFVAGPNPTAINRLLGAAPEASLANNQYFKEANALFTQRPGSAFVYIDGPAVLQASRTATQELSPLGFDRIHWLGLSFEPDGDCMRHRFEVRANADHGAATLFTEKSQFDSARFYPANTVLLTQLAVNGEQSAQALRRMFIQYPGKEAPAMNYNKRMKLMRERFGTDIDELLSLVGNEISAAVVAPDSGVIPDIYMIARAKSNEAATRLSLLVEMAARRAEPELGLSTSTFKNRTIVTTQPREGGPAPAMTVEGDLVVFSSSFFSMKRWILFREDAAAVKLADSKQYIESMGALGAEPATAYVWADWGAITKFTYGNFAQIAPMFMGVAASESRVTPGPTGQNKENEQGETTAQGLHSNKSRKLQIAPGLELDLSKLPAPETIARYIRPQALRLRVNSTGLSVESRAIF